MPNDTFDLHKAPPEPPTVPPPEVPPPPNTPEPAPAPVDDPPAPAESPPVREPGRAPPAVAGMYLQAMATAVPATGHMAGATAALLPYGHLVDDAVHAFDALCDVNRATSLRLRLDEAAQLHLAAQRFHLHRRALDIGVGQQSRLHFGGDGRVIHFLALGGVMGACH